MEISFVIPSYNEENRIIHTVSSMLSFLEKHFRTYEVIVVDDGSQDKTVENLAQCKFEHVHIINPGKNRGKGYAVKTGMELAKGEYCFFTDADLPYAMESIVHAMAIFKKGGADLVIGSRDLFKDKPDKPYPLYRKVMSKTFSAYMNFILNLDIKDTQCGFKGFSYDAAKKIFPLLTVEGFGFDVELLYIAKKYNMSIKTIPVNLRHTKDSKVHVVRDSLNMMKDTMKVKINGRRGIY